MIGGVAGGASGVGCEIGTEASPDDGARDVPMPLVGGADGDEAGGGPLDPVSTVDRVDSTGTPGAGVAGAVVDGTAPGVGVCRVTLAVGGTRTAGPNPGPERVGAAITNGARAMTTIKPMTIPTPVCVSLDGIATSPET
jgi:hypothetical protein